MEDEKATAAGTAISIAREAEKVKARSTTAAVPTQMLTVTTAVTAVEPFKTPVTITITGAI